MRRIALITPILPVPLDPTRGRFIYETARALSKIATVRVFLEQPRIPVAGLRSGIHSAAEIVGSDFRLEGIDVEAFTYPAMPLLSRAINGYACGVAVLPRLRRFQPDAVLAYWVYPDGFGAVRAARSLGVPVILGAIGTDVLQRTGISARLTRRALRAADRIIVVSQHMAGVVARAYGADPEKTFTVINGFNVAIFHPRSQFEARAKLGLKHNVKWIVYVGRLVEAKGLFDLLEAIRTVESVAGAPVSLALLGNGPMRGALEAKAENLGISDRVLFLGGQLPETVAWWISAADLLTLPSWSEGYPNVLVEAIACGRPVVATDVGGVREIITDENGILVPSREPGLLAEGLRRALNTPWDYAAIESSIRRSWDDVASDTLAICERVPASEGSPKRNHA